MADRPKIFFSPIFSQKQLRFYSLIYNRVYTKGFYFLIHGILKMILKVKNVLDFKNRVTKSKAKSKKFFEENRRKFDFIYIDGSHYYDDVLNDAKEGFKILKEDCYMLLDDCDWNFYEYGKNPINAINLFLKLNKEKIEIIYISSQVLIKKIS